MAAAACTPYLSMTRPPDIIQLPDALANQIAAGEVIERPSAVVKELVENSLDAGAQRITIRIDDGGRRLIEVEDDGHGMRADDLRHALGRHATSKLRSQDDLFRIGTLGFRGEALPSIAAVSEMELISRPHSQEAAWHLAVRGGMESAWGPASSAFGTRIAVRNLFWNVPARLKFLKSEASETGHVTDQVIRLALSHPHVAFRLEVHGRIHLDLPAGHDLFNRVRSIFGADFADGLVPLAQGNPGLEITGFIAHPREAKPTSKRQYCFLNGRFLRDRLILAAVREGFKGFLEPRLHGAVILHLDVDPSQVDVNVHPTKSEVRFRNEGAVFALVSRSIQATLGEVSRTTTPLLDTSERSMTGMRTQSPQKPPSAASMVIQERFLPSPGPQVVPAQQTTMCRAEEPPSPYVPSAPVARASPPRPPRDIARIRQIVQLDDSYLLIETDTGIRLVDQHALHEKALLTLLDPRVGDLASDGRQELLVPRSIALGAAEVAAVAPYLGELTAIGVEAEVFGPTTIIVRSHPVQLRRLDWERFFTEMAADGAERVMADVRGHIRHRAACHAAVKAHQRLTPEEQRELAELLLHMDGLEHCPHGRPTTLDLPWADLARRFQR